MNSQLALLVVLCAHASASDKTPKIDISSDAAAVVVKKATSSQTNGASLLPSCSSVIDEINVGVEGIVAKTGVEYLYLPMTADNQVACFESYNNTVLVSSDLVSCCDAAAKGEYNSFRFDGGECKGFQAWLSPIYTQCTGDESMSPGLFVAKQKLSNFTPTAPTFDTSTSLKLARIAVDVTNIVDACPYSKTLKVTTYSKSETIKLESRIGLTHNTNFYLPELCDDSASTAKRTVTISVLDSDGSVLVSVTEVPSNGLTGRNLLPNGVCVLQSESPLRNHPDAFTFCKNVNSYLPFGNGFSPFEDLLQKLAGFKVQVMDFWTGASTVNTGKWRWTLTNRPINLSLINVQSFNLVFQSTSVLANVTDKRLYNADENALHHTVCIDAPYIGFD